MEVVCCALIEYGHVLVQKRKPEQTYAGEWVFPGGKVEWQESFVDAIRREMFEEVGVRLFSGSLQRVCRIENRRPMFGLTLFTSCDYQRSPIAREGQELRWVDYRNLLKPFCKLASPNRRLVKVAGIDTFTYREDQ